MGTPPLASAGCPQGAGQREEGSLGLYYYGARWYDRIAGAKRHPALGRFIQPDTIVPNPGDAQSFVHAVGAKRHRYAYVLNNPLKYVDPTGHCGVSAIAGPPGLLLDIPCWGSGVGEVVVAATGAAVVGAAAAPLVVNYVLNEEPLDMPPLYPELAPEVAQGGLLVTIPVPDSTTVTSGIPLIPDETLPLISSSSGDVPSQQVLADPLVALDMENNIVYSSEDLPRGGTYLLRDPETGQVMRTGRTGDLARRQKEHARGDETSGLIFEVDRRTDIYAAQRGREQIIHELYNPPLNRNTPIRLNHKKREEYLRAGRALN